MKKTLFTLAAAVLATGAAWADSETGKISRDYWTGHEGGLGKVKENIQKSVAPTGSDTLTSFEAVSWTDPKKTANFADKYGQRVYGLIIPEKDGEYIFWIAADDSAELMLSTDSKPENAKRIAHVKTWTPPKDYKKHPEQKSAPVKLEAGKKYYIEAIMYEGGGGDNLSVAWAESSEDPTPTVIMGKNLASVPKDTPSAYAPKKK